MKKMSRTINGLYNNRSLHKNAIKSRIKGDKVNKSKKVNLQQTPSDIDDTYEECDSIVTNQITDYCVNDVYCPVSSTDSIPTYIVTKLFKMEHVHDMWDNDYYENYVSMVELCHLSCKKFMPHCAIKHYTQTVEYIYDGFKNIYYYIKELWESEPCNILHLDCDVLLFNTLDLDQIHDFCIWHNNCGVRYFPHTMSKKTWEIGDFGFKNYEYYWDYEECIYNIMYTGKEENQISVLLGHSYEVKECGNNDFKILNYNMDDIDVLHYTSTHCPPQVLEIMENHAKVIGIT